MSAGPFEFVFQENHSFVFTQAPHCRNCTRVLDDAAIDPDAELPDPVFDISVTYDGCAIVSDAFIAACGDLAGARFVPISGVPGFSVLIVDRVVAVEPFESHVRAGPACDTCEQPRYVTRKGPLHLLESVERGFSRTDQTFGDTADFGPNQPIRMRPVILVDEESGRALKAVDLRGVHLIQHP